VNGAG